MRNLIVLLYAPDDLQLITQEVCWGSKSHNLLSVWNKTEVLSQSVPGKHMQGLVSQSLVLNWV